MIQRIHKTNKELAAHGVVSKDKCFVTVTISDPGKKWQRVGSLNVTVEQLEDMGFVRQYVE